MTASLSVYLSYHWLTIVQSSLNTSCHTVQLQGHGRCNIQHWVNNITIAEMWFLCSMWRPNDVFLVFGCAQSCASGHWDFFLLCLFSLHSLALLTTCNCFIDLSFVRSPNTEVHVSLFQYTSLKIDVLRSSSMGWKWPQTGLIILLLHCS